MKVKINNKEIEVAAGTSLAEALAAHGVAPQGIATAVNGKVIPAANRESYQLADGDTVTVIKAFYGG